MAIPYSTISLVENVCELIFMKIEQKWWLFLFAHEIYFNNKKWEKVEKHKTLILFALITLSQKKFEIKKFFQIFVKKKI